MFICTVVFFFLTRRPDWLNIKILTYGPEGDRLGLDIADIEALLTRIELELEMLPLLTSRKKSK